MKVNFKFHFCSLKVQPPSWNGVNSTVHEYLVFFVEKGGVTGHIDGQPIDVESGSVIWIPPGTQRQFISTNKSSNTVSRRLKFELFAKSGTQFVFSESAIIKRNSWELLPYYQLLSREKNTEGVFHEEKTRYLISSFAASFFAIPNFQEKSECVFNQNERNCIEDYIIMGLSTGISSEKLAKKMRLSHDYFTRKFKKTYAVSPRTFIKNQRIKNAAELFAESNLSVKELCNIIKENDLSKFCKQFREVMGCSPTQYRKKFRL